MSQEDRTNGTQTLAGAGSFYTRERIARMPELPWPTAKAKEAVSLFDHLAVRLFRGEPGEPHEQRSRPGGVLLLAIPTFFRGPHQALALGKMAYYLAETPLEQGIPSVFGQAARIAGDADTETWASSTVRAIEYGTLEYVSSRIRGVSTRGLSRQAQAIRSNLRSVIPVLKATKSNKLLAICRICEIALQIVSQNDYTDVAMWLDECIKLLGTSFKMQSAADQLTDLLVVDEAITAASEQQGRHVARSTRTPQPAGTR
jgi:hypothetical protein